MKSVLFFFYLFLFLLGYNSHAQPSISSAVRNGTTMSISGSSFGTKSPAAPIKFQPFTSTTQGQLYAAAGFDFVGGGNAGNAHNYVDMSDGVGGGSWLHVTDSGSESFSHFGHLLPANTNAVFASHWVRIRRMTGAPSLPGPDVGQYKGLRFGVDTSNGADPVDGMYYRGPKYYFSTYSNIEDVNSLSGPDAYIDNAAGLIDFFYPEGNYNVPLISNAWQYCEGFGRFNTVGQANGIFRVRFNGTQHVNLTDQQPRENSSEFIEYIQWSPGLSGDMAYAGWEARYSRLYLDTTEARVFLGNASTLAATTGRFLLPPSAWGSTSISVSNVANVPTGYTWVYVCDSSNSCNSNGYAYTTAASSSRLMLFLRR